MSCNMKLVTILAMNPWTISSNVFTANNFTVLVHHSHLTHIQLYQATFSEKALMN